MQPVNPIPDTVLEAYPNYKVLAIGPPEGVPETEIGVSMTLIAQVSGGFLDGSPVMRTFFQPDEEEIEILKNGGFIELVFLSNGMPPHDVKVIGNGTQATT